eukprot:SAG11_NODE_46_length_20454_cov_11.499386_10_plen_101_part_00
MKASGSGTTREGGEELGATDAKAGGGELEALGSLNMMSAFLHVFADSLRSFTTLLEAALIGIWGYDGRRTDAYASLFVSTTSARVVPRIQTCTQPCASSV